MPNCADTQPAKTGSISFVQTDENSFEISLKCSDPQLVQHEQFAPTLQRFLAGSITGTTPNRDGLSIRYNNVPRSPYPEWTDAIKGLLERVTDNGISVSSYKVFLVRWRNKTVETTVRLEQQQGEAGILGEIFTHGASDKLPWWDAKAAIVSLKFFLDTYHVTTIPPPTERWIRVVLLPK